MRHADDEHRATSDPSEGHTVKAGEGKARALLVLDGKGNGAVFNARFFNKVDIRLNNRNRQGIISFGLFEAVGAVCLYSRDLKGEVGQRIVAAEGVGSLTV